MEVKLSTAQIRDIAETLGMNGVIYEDIKSELVDHIASQIESLLKKNEDLSYEDAFKTAFTNWKKELRGYSNGIWISRKVTAPKIIMDRWVSYSKRRFLYIMAISTLLTSLICFGFIKYDNGSTVLEDGIRLFFTINLGLVILGRILIWKYKINTSIGYLYKRRSLMIFFMPLMIVFRLFRLTILHSDASIHYTMTFFFIALNIYFVLDFPLVLEHIKINKKLNIA